MKLKQYLSIIQFKARAELKAESQRTYLGFLWWVFEPIMYLAIFYLIFSKFRQSNIENFVQFLLVGLVFWKWFSASILQSISVVLVQVNLLRQVRISAWLFPLIKVYAAFFKFLIVLSLLFALLWLTNFTPTINYIYLLEIIVIQFLLITGIVLTLSSIVPFVPDIRFIVDNLMVGMFFLSGIFFAISNVPEPYRAYVYLNPMVHIIENARLVLINDKAPNQLHLMYVLAVAVGFIVVGLFLFSRFQNKYAKISES